VAAGIAAFSIATGPALLLGLGVAAATMAVGALVGAKVGALGGGWLGAAVGGAAKFIGGIFTGVSKSKEKSVGEKMQDLRVQAAVSEEQANAAEAYLRQQQRAAAVQAVANPDAPSNNAAKIAAQAADPTRSTSQSM
jgi:hypothetical protein